MELSLEQIQDIRSAVIYYMHHMISINNPRYNDYKVILQLLENDKEQ